MTNETGIARDEVILRRIRKDDPECVHALPEGGFRATSKAIKRRRDEAGSSFTRLSKTSPSKLLQLVQLQDLQPDDYTICRLKIADVLEGWTVIATYDANDPGHCEIRPPKDISPSAEDKGWSKIAKRTRILTDYQIESLKPGDLIE